MLQLRRGHRLQPPLAGECRIRSGRGMQYGRRGLQGRLRQQVGSVRPPSGGGRPARTSSSPEIGLRMYLIGAEHVAGAGHPRTSVLAVMKMKGTRAVARLGIASQARTPKPVDTGHQGGRRARDPAANAVPARCRHRRRPPASPRNHRRSALRRRSHAPRDRRRSRRTRSMRGGIVARPEIDGAQGRHRFEGCVARSGLRLGRRAHLALPSFAFSPEQARDVGGWRGTA